MKNPLIIQMSELYKRPLREVEKAVEREVARETRAHPYIEPTYLERLVYHNIEKQYQHS